MGECPADSCIGRRPTLVHSWPKLLARRLHSTGHNSFWTHPTSLPGLLNMDKRSIRYEIVRPHQLAIVHQLLYESFYVDEPMTRHLGLCQGPHTIKDGDLMVENLVKEHNVSILASDRDSGAPLAVVLNGVMKREEAEATLDQVVDSCLESKFAPIAAILLHAQALSKEVFLRANSSELFDIKIIAVSPVARGLGLATDLVQRSLQLAKCLGYRGAKTEATGNYSRKAMAKCGLKEEVVIPYNSFSLKGTKPFNGILDHEGVAFMSTKF